MPSVDPPLQLDRHVLAVIRIVMMMSCMSTMSPSVIHPPLDVEVLGQVKNYNKMDPKMTSIPSPRNERYQQIHRQRITIRKTKAMKLMMLAC